MGRITAAAFHFFIRYQQFSYYTTSTVFSSDVAIAIKRIKIMNTFLAQICIICFYLFNVPCNAPFMYLFIHQIN